MKTILKIALAFLLVFCVYRVILACEVQEPVSTPTPEATSTPLPQETPVAEETKEPEPTVDSRVDSSIPTCEQSTHLNANQTACVAWELGGAPTPPPVTTLASTGNQDTYYLVIASLGAFLLGMGVNKLFKKE